MAEPEEAAMTSNESLTLTALGKGAFRLVRSDQPVPTS